MKKMFQVRYLLWLDSLGGLSVGLGVLILNTWLADWYRLPREVVFGLGCANLAYGCYSFALACFKSWRSHRTITTLAFANVAWGVGCLVVGCWYLAVASPFGLLHLFGEGAFVAALGMVEYRYRHEMVWRSSNDG